jgi:cytochrome P450 family 9
MEYFDEFGKKLSSDMRSTLSPAFTGSKMRQMFGFVRDVGQQTAASMSDKIKNGGESAFEFKALAMKFTVDVIASCAFGIEVNSFKNPENEFYKIADRVTNASMFKTILKFFGYKIAPRVMKYFEIEMIDKDITDFFKAATIDTMKTREEKRIIRHDMINLLMEAKKGKLKHSSAEEKTSDGFATVEESVIGKSEVKRAWDDNDLTAQTLLFFLAGFETVEIVNIFYHTRNEEKLFAGRDNNEFYGL